jgi:DNA primase large subunit|tara:strand:+ start:7032 stop:8069 length:1038 start_codon:yes stop_codon:yes gene_type:complete
LISIDLGQEDLAKYPFLDEAGDYIKARDLSLVDISQPDFNLVIRRARQRVLQAIRSREVSGEMDTPEIEILSFPIALILVKAANLDHLISRYSHAEAIRVEKFLEDEREDLIVEIFRNILKINVVLVTSKISFSKHNYKISIIDYLRRATRFHELQWKLINRKVDNGNVYLKSNELIRLIRQEIESKIQDKLKEMVVPQLPQSFIKTIQELSILSPPPPKLTGKANISPDKYPPCVKAALDLLKKGENLPHYGRFLLTTYLVNIGESVDEIMSLYSRSPDFNERITKYQVEHIAGLKGGRVKYTCPSCRTLITHGFCFKTKECNKIRNPLQFGVKTNLKSNRKRK